MLPFVLCDINECQVIQNWTDRAVDITGFTSAETIGRPCFDVFQSRRMDGRRLCEPNCEPMACYRQGMISSDVCAIKAKDGKFVAGRLAGIPTQSVSGIKLDAVRLYFWKTDEKRAGNREAWEVPQIRANLLGRFGVAVNGVNLSIESWPRRQAVLLLKVLLLNIDKPVHRERIAEILWPESQSGQAWVRLRVLVYFLRERFRHAGIADGLIKTIAKSYSISSNRCWLDTLEFERSVQAALQLRQMGQEGFATEALRIAEHHYRGDLLEEDLYVDSFMHERRRLRQLFLKVGRH